MNKPTTTCQICGRPILANTGLIAHHGYQRPGDGYQTKSCMGAKYLPYEASCNRIQYAIDATNSYMTGVEARLAEWIATPPAEVTARRKDSNGKYTTYARPEGFIHDTYEYAHTFRTYEGEYYPQVREMRRTIGACKEQIAYLTDRLQKWVAPQGVLIWK